MFRRISVILITFMFFASCAEENPDLVNPPDRTGSIRFRFLNLGLDKSPKIFEVTEGKRTASIPWQRLSNSDNPPADTGFVRVFNNNILEYEQENMVRFLRNTNYTYVGLSSTVCDDRSQCKIDTLIALRTTAAVPESNFETLVKFMNAYPDTTARFSIRLGCPSGDILFGMTDYKQYSISPITVRSGQFNFSVIKTVFEDGQQTNIYLNLYSTELNPRGQYVIIAHEDDLGEVQISILDENDLSENALKPVMPVENTTTEIRTINMSSSELKIEMNDGSIVDPGVSPLMVDDYKVIDVCKSSFLDTINVMSSGNLKSTLATSLEVLSRYSIVVYDSADVRAGGSLLIEPLKLNVDDNNRAIVRVVNTIDNTGGVNVSIGARKENDRTVHSRGYSSGISLARNLQFSEVSNAVVVTPGPAPLSVFTAAEPARLLFAANTILEPNKSYLIITALDDRGNVKLTIIDDEDESINVEYLSQGVFFQLVNAMTDNSILKVSISSGVTSSAVLEDAELFPTNSLATVIDENSQTIYINGQPFQADANSTERIMTVAAGKSGDLKIITNKFNPLTAEQRHQFRVRYVNATYDLPIIMLKKSDSDESFFQGVEQNTFSSYEPPETREQKPTFFFYDNENPNYVARFSDVTLSLGKSYCIILYGETRRECIKYFIPQARIAPTCYSIIIQQEF